MRLLILGGTVFVGRHLVDAALERRHQVTLFNRGQHNPDLFPDVEKLRGDRDGNLDALRLRQWDAGIDTCGYVPRIVRTSAELLADRVEHYTFISSISVYAGQGTDENSPVGRLDDESVEQVTGQTYGPLKALCEQAAEHVMPGRVLNVRAGVIVGPHDPTDRFTYWVQRVARGGEVLAPGRPDRPVQFVDVRDLAGWIVRALETHVTGVYNATGPRDPMSLGHLLDAIRRVSGSDARFTWVDEGFLTDAGVTPWTEVPLWIPESQPSANAMLSVNCQEALAAGLAYRPLADTIRDTLDWDVTRPSDSERRAGLKAEREAELLKDWREREGR